MSSKKKRSEGRSCLLVLDVEGTLFDKDVYLSDSDYHGTIWQSIAKSLGEDAVEEELKTQKKWENGEYETYIDWMRETILIHKRYGLRKEEFYNVIRRASYNEGVKDILSSITESKFEPVLVSGGFMSLARRVQMDFGIHHAFAACEYFFNSEGYLESFNLLPCDFKGKIDFIELMLEEYSLSSQDWVFIGDSSNDQLIADEAPFSIGYKPSDDLRSVVDVSVDDFGSVSSYL